MNNRFVFIMPAFNAESTISRSILSVWMQTHANWKIIVLDDMSTDKTMETVLNVKKMIGANDDKIQLIVNDNKKWEVGNIVEGLNHCDSKDIVCRLDGDDWLCDTDALTIINYKYNQLGCNALWTSHRWSFSNQNISSNLPKNADPYEHPWVSSHLKTFKKELIESVPDNNFRGPDGNYFKRIGDQALYLPVLHQSAGNWHYEPIVAYHYTIDMNPKTFQSDDAKFQKSEAEFLRNRGFLK
jgi:glycosyltransferase involved in cell wall biosynthesis